MLTLPGILKYAEILGRRGYFAISMVPGYQEHRNNGAYRQSRTAEEVLARRAAATQMREALRVLASGDRAAFLDLADNMNVRYISMPNWRAWQRSLAPKGVSVGRCASCGAAPVFLSAAEHCDDCEASMITTEDGFRRLPEHAYRHPNGKLYSYAFRYVAEYHSHPDRDIKVRYHKPDSDDPLREDNLELGFEYEYNSEHREGDAKRLYDTTWCVCEEDGSLDSKAGMEVVTGYSTLGSVKRWADEVTKAVRVRDLNDAGLHVGISGLRENARAKFIHFFSSPKTEALIRIVAGRYNSEYARASDYRIWALGYLWRAYIDGEYEERSKYRHVRDRDDYLEVRVFRSFEEPERIKAALEFVWAVAKFCAQPGVKLDQHTFVAWIAATPWVRKHVPELENRLAGSTLAIPVKKRKEKACLQMSLA